MNHNPGKSQEQSALSVEGNRVVLRWNTVINAANNAAVTKAYYVAPQLKLDFQPQPQSFKQFVQAPIAEIVTTQPVATPAVVEQPRSAADEQRVEAARLALAQAFSPLTPQPDQPGASDEFARAA